MSDAIIVALITGAFAVIAQVVINRKSQSDLYTKLDKSSEIADMKLEARLEKHQATTDIKIEALRQSVEKHNQFASRVPLLEEKVARLEQYHKPN